MRPLGWNINSTAEKNAYLENSDGQMVFLCPDYFVGLGHVYEMEIDFYWNPMEAASHDWKGFMGFYSPSMDSFGRLYMSAPWDERYFQLTFGTYIGIIKYSELGSITETRGTVKAVYDIPNSGMGRAIFFVNGEEFAVGTSNVNAFDFDGAVKQGGILCGCDYGDYSSTTPYTHTNSVIGSRLYKFTEKIDGELVHDLRPLRDCTLGDVVTNSVLTAIRGTPVYGEGA